jgi:hypothetical protein
MEFSLQNVIKKGGMTDNVKTTDHGINTPQSQTFSNVCNLTKKSDVIKTCKETSKISFIL